MTPEQAAKAEAAAIHPHGYWLTRGDEIYDSPLGEALTSFFRAEHVWSVGDFGCSPGAYVKQFLHAGIRAIGYDGSPWVNNVPNCHTMDLATRVCLGPFDWVLSLETGEHIPADYEQIFLDNLAYSASYGLVLSWAIPGQGGRGHVNCRSNEYVTEELAKRGFRYDDEAVLNLRAVATEWYFKNTLMVFRRIGVKGVK